MLREEIAKLKDEDELSLTKTKYKRLSDKITEILDAQNLYFKTKDFQLLRKSKVLETELRNTINPKPTSQAEIEWLGQ